MAKNVTAWALEVPHAGVLPHTVKRLRSEVFADCRKMGWTNARLLKRDGMKVVKVKLSKVASESNSNA